VRHYGTIARPLNDLMHQKAFSHNSATQEAFDQLKIAMSSTPVLAFPDFSKEFAMETDACDTGIAAVLTQEGHLIDYFSKGLSSSN
jgi:hypothetical protein